MDLIVGKEYTTDEMKEFFSVSNDKWKKERDKLLMHLSIYYDYEVKYDRKDARRRIYTILSQKSIYEPYKSVRQQAIDKRDKVFEKEILDVIENDNLQTAKNISRIIDKDIKEELNYETGTIYEYTRLRVNKWFGKGNNTVGTKGMITDKIWCYLDINNNCYIPLNEKQIHFLFSTYSKEINDIHKKELESFSDYENGLITKEELNNAIGNTRYMCFVTAKDEFKSKYGYYPIKVPVYSIGVFSNNAFDVKEGEFTF